MKKKMLIHGGDCAGYAEVYGKKPLDFSSNVSPLGLPEGVRTAAEEALADAGCYPDPLCRALRREIAEAEGVDPAWCLCGAGAADLIYRVALAKRPKRAVVTAPAFAEYEAALELVGCDTVRHMLREENCFQVSPDFLEQIVPGVDLVFLCQPNNPTGRTVPKPLLQAVLERCRKIGGLLVMDECFCDLLEVPDKYTMKDALADYQNLLILKAFTKRYAMAGLRLGYCLCSDQTLLAAMNRAGQPWAVSGPTQAAGIAALRETEYAKALGALVAKERPLLAAALMRLGFRVVPGEANYLLFFSSTPLLEPLAQRGILLRSCANYHGLDEGWYRTAVRTAEENQRLIAALEDVLKGGLT